MPTITIEITELEKKIMENDVLSAQDWAVKAVQGKIDQCRKRIVQSNTQTLLNDPEVDTIPATEEGICENLFNTAGNHNRVAREPNPSPRGGPAGGTGGRGTRSEP